MVKYIIRAVTLETEGKAGWLSQPAYLLDFDPDAFDGRGDVEFTSDKAKAKRFNNHAEVFACYRAQPRNRPLRADGKPNRPLTAFTIEVERVNE